jgi:broad specificity phosphatase PhoE
MITVPWIYRAILCLFLSLAFFVRASAEEAVAASRLFFVRHGQTFSNAGGKASTSNGDVHSLSELGQQQAEALVGDLKPHTFTAIAVSPMDRAIATLAPYLRATSQQAEVWPELAECCYQKDQAAAPTGVEPQRPFEAPEFARDVLLIPKENPPHWLRSDTYQDGLAQVALAAERIDAYLKTPGRTLLAGGHSLNGSRLIEKLAGDKAAGLHLENGKLTILRREADGRYLLEMRNGIPVAPAEASASGSACTAR